MRQMQSDDLGDPRVFEDEAIREQAARLQVNVNNLAIRLENNNCASRRTMVRVVAVSHLAQDVQDIVEALFNDNPL